MFLTLNSHYYFVESYKENARRTHPAGLPCVGVLHTAARVTRINVGVRGTLVPGWTLLTPYSVGYPILGRGILTCAGNATQHPQIHCCVTGTTIWIKSRCATGSIHSVAMRDMIFLYKDMRHFRSPLVEGITLHH